MSKLSSPDTYVSQNQSEHVLRLASAIWHERRGVGRIIEYLTQDHGLSKLVCEVDSAIVGLNGLKGAMLDRSFQNIQSLTQLLELKRQRLPQLNAPDACSVEGNLAISHILGSMAPLMIRAEQGQSGSRLTFASNGKLTPQQAAVGGIVQFAGRHVSYLLGISPDTEVVARRGQQKLEPVAFSELVMDAILEAHVRDPSLHGSTILRATHEMGWFGSSDNSGPFSPEVSVMAAGLVR